MNFLVLQVFIELIAVLLLNIINDKASSVDNEKQGNLNIDMSS